MSNLHFDFYKWLHFINNKNDVTLFDVFRAKRFIDITQVKTQKSKYLLLQQILYFHIMDRLGVLCKQPKIHIEFEKWCYEQKGTFDDFDIDKEPPTFAIKSIALYRQWNVY